MAFVYAGDRATSSPAQHLAGYRGVLQTDGYSAYKALAKAIRYALTHWDGLIRLLDDGRIELDTNTAERPIRPWR